MSEGWTNINWNNTGWSNINWNDKWNHNWNDVGNPQSHRGAHIHVLYLEMMDEADPKRRQELFDEMADVVEGKK